MPSTTSRATRSTSRSSCATTNWSWPTAALFGDARLRNLTLLLYDQLGTFLGLVIGHTVLVHKRTGEHVPMTTVRDVWMREAMDAQRPYCPAEPMDSEDLLFLCVERCWHVVSCAG